MNNLSQSIFTNKKRIKESYVSQSHRFYLILNVNIQCWSGNLHKDLKGPTVN